MRWIDIDLSPDMRSRGATDLLERAAAVSGDLCLQQTEHGADSPLVMRTLESIGLYLFQACMSTIPDAFRPDEDRICSSDPFISDVLTDEAVLGYHIIVDNRYMALPWASLHNGINFIIEKHPLCVAETPSDHATRIGSAWARRREEISFTQQALGPVSLDDIVTRMRPENAGMPEILYMGRQHDLQSEGELLADSLESTSRGRLAGFRVQPEPPTPAGIIRSGQSYQGFHFSDDTMQADAAQGSFESIWLGDQDEGPIADILEKDVVGVDQITSLLDDINERFETGHRSRHGFAADVQATLTIPACWQTEDGPVRPEDLAYHQATPPMIFSNSYCGLTRLGPRFLDSGADVFIGPLARIPRRTARVFAASFYHHFGKGVSAAEAFRYSVLDLRAQEGDWNPLWLMYGIIGQGSLALQYL